MSGDLATPKFNHFSLLFSNVNGTGSASANHMIAKTIFRMGVPISPKNLFPSNIQGMPTWYEIHVRSNGFGGRSKTIDLAVCMNLASRQKDLEKVRPGGFFMYDSTFEQTIPHQSHITLLPLPVTKLARDEFTHPKQRSLLQNGIYVGALVFLLGLDQEIVHELLEELYGKQASLLPLNKKALEIGFTHAKNYFVNALPFQVKRTQDIQNKILIDGNTALALGCVYAGATVVGWYPITPSTSVVDQFTKYCREFRTDSKTKEKSYAIVQAEDEISALGIVLGAMWNGARAFTASSGPGLSLMTEFLGLAYYSEIPAVIFNIQRCGPSTGMPTRTQQADLLSCAYASHGDTKHILLFPSDPHECFEFAFLSFNFAERFQTPVIVMSDLDIAMNDFVTNPLALPKDATFDRGHIFDEKALEERTKPFFRYEDTGDGTTPRTYPGVHQKGAYFTRGSGHDRFGRYTEDGDLYKENLDRISKKFLTAAEELPEPLFTQHKQQTIKGLVVYYGSSKEPLAQALHLLMEQGHFFDELQIRSFPFTQKIISYFSSYEKIFLVEQNRDAQMKKLLCIELELDPKKIISVLSYDGLQLEAEFLVTKILSLMET